MTCPAEVARVLLDILKIAILGARTAGWNGNAEVAAREMDHVHNLPGLLADFSWQRLRYYRDVERASYLSSGSTGARFQRCWEQLDAMMEEPVESRV